MDIGIGNIIYIIISTLVSLTSIIIAGMAFKKKRLDGWFLCSTLVFAACICMFYLISVLTTSRFTMSLFCSMMFASFDLMILSLFGYIRVFASGRRGLTPIILLPLAYAVFDITVFMINPWYEIALSYSYNAATVVHWKYVPYLCYNLHLVYTYLMMMVIFAFIIGKIITTPNAYKSRYTNILITVLVIVVINALYLFVPDYNLFDFSMLFYSVAGLVLYWNNYNYSKNGMLNKTRQLIVDELNHPMILFDYEKKFVMDNKATDEFFGQDKRITDKNFNLCDFIAYCGFNEINDSSSDDTSFRWVRKIGSSKKIYRVDYHVLRDNKGMIIGYLFMFTDNSLEFDILTGFHTITEFRRHFAEDEGAAVLPLSVTVCDINNLSRINMELGENVGDSAIKTLAGLMQHYFPEDTYFARLNEATLAAICGLTSYDTLKAITDDVNYALKHSEQFEGGATIQNAIAIIDGVSNDVISATETAVASMKAKKLLDKYSAHSSLLESLVQTLRESDDETEAHVRRTTRLGQQLSDRLKLSDQEKNNLALLCMLHDIGKVGIPLEILNKPGRLTNEEWQIMKSHTEKGYRIARASHELNDIADLILHHHECWDGSGYPYGLRGEEIPLLSRIIAIVDTYDAMTNDRVYRKALTESEAVAELKKYSGIQFDPMLLDEFLEVLKNNSRIDLDIDAIQPDNEDDFVNKPASIVETITKNSNKKSSSKKLIYSRYILDSDNFIIEVDQNFEVITGYSAEDVRRLRLSQKDLIPEKDWNQYQSLVHEEITTHHETYIEHRLQKADGRLITVHCIGKEFFNAVSREGRTDIVITKVKNS